MNKFSKLIAALCAILLMISLFAVPAFAEGEASDNFDQESGDVADGETGDGSEDSDKADDADKDDDKSDKSDKKDAEKKGLTTAQIVWIIVGGVVLVVAVVLCIKFRTQIVKGLRVYKSEFKKVSWLSWEQTRKSTLIVLVVLVICALVICLMDFALSGGIRWLLLEAFKSPAGK